jgi:hypothetical protein
MDEDGEYDDEEGEESDDGEIATGVISEKEQDIEALREILMKEHVKRMEEEKLRAKENPGSISKKKMDQKLWRKGKKKARKQKWDLSPSGTNKKFKMRR